MSGAQGAQPEESLTPTTYESVPAEENKTRLDPRSKEDEGMIKIEKQQDKVEDAAGGGRPRVRCRQGGAQAGPRRHRHRRSLPRTWAFRAIMGFLSPLR
ncbi:unnamed protein product [Musa acuminata subsp. burmannicoides]